MPCTKQPCCVLCISQGAHETIPLLTPTLPIEILAFFIQAVLKTRWEKSHPFHFLPLVLCWCEAVSENLLSKEFFNSGQFLGLFLDSHELCLISNPCQPIRYLRLFFCLLQSRVFFSFHYFFLLTPTCWGVSCQFS